MKLKRREFLAAGAAAMAAASLPRDATAQEAAAGEEHPIGEFILKRSGDGLRVAHKSKPDRVIWETAPGGNFIIAENAKADIKDFGTPEAFFTLPTPCRLPTRS